MAIENCPKCDGEGVITMDVGWDGTTVTCGDCNGRGY